MIVIAAKVKQDDENVSRIVKLSTKLIKKIAISTSFHVKNAMLSMSLLGRRKRDAVCVVRKAN